MNSTKFADDLNTKRSKIDGCGGGGRNDLKVWFVDRRARSRIEGVEGANPPSS